MSLDRILKRQTKTILDWNRDQMYEHGIIDVRNESKREKYSPATIKAKKKAPYNKTEFITLKWTGKFHDGLKLDIREKDILIKSDYPAWKYHYKEARLGNALGLTKENIGNLRDKVKEEIIKELRDVI